MNNKFKATILGVAAAAMLMVPAAVNAQTKDDGGITRNQPGTTVPQVPRVNHFLGNVNLAPGAYGPVELVLPAAYRFNVQSIEVTGPLSQHVHVQLTELGYKILFSADSFNTTVTVKITNFGGDWGYYTVNVQPVG